MKKLGIFPLLLLSLFAMSLLVPSAQAGQKYVVMAKGNTKLPELDHRFQVLRGGTIEMSSQRARSLRQARPGLIIEADQRAYLPDPKVSSVAAETNWGRDRLDQRALPLDGLYNPMFSARGGRGVIAYVFDTGAYSAHNDYAGKLLPGKDFWRDPTGTEDCDGHGTHVSSTIVGARYGLAPEARVVPVRVINCLRWVSTVLVIEGVDWMLANHPKGRPGVMNLSLHTDRTDALRQALLASKRAGILPIAAAGNSNEDACRKYPAGIPEILTVAATSTDDSQASFSSWGSCVDIFAPGNMIYGAAIDGPDAGMYRSGTSMAAPHATGAAAVLLGQYPRLSADALAELLIRNSIAGIVKNPGVGSPNRLLWMGPGTGFYDPGVPNDYFASPRALAPEKCVRDKNILASREEGEPAHGASGYSLWYTFRSSVRKRYSLKTFRISPLKTALDTRIVVYRGNTVSGLTPVARSTRSAAKNTLEATLSFQAAANVTYRVAIDASREGEFNFCGRSA